jgi:hypothetical protein
MRRTRRDVEIELDGIVAEGRDHAFRFGGTGLRIGLVLGVEVTVDPDLVAILPTDELIGRDIKELPGDIVEGGLDAGDCGDDLAGNGPLAGHLLDEVFVESVDVEGILPDNKRLHPVYDGCVAATPVRLPGADDSSVRVDAS